MAASYSVRADVVDIVYDQPRATDALFVDTNVWYWMDYLRSGEADEQHKPLPYQVRNYPTYLKKALRAKAALLRCGLTLAELAHRIESTEHEAYVRAFEDVSPKEFRHNFPDIRANVVQEISDAWGLVKLQSRQLDIMVDEPTTEEAMARFATHAVDGYDMFILLAMARAGITQMLTDDGDYCTVAGIQVFTANRGVIEQAREQSKLVTRS